jgi:hypothetical protein
MRRGQRTLFGRPAFGAVFLPHDQGESANITSVLHSHCAGIWIAASCSCSTAAPSTQMGRLTSLGLSTLGSRFHGKRRRSRGCCRYDVMMGPDDVSMGSSIAYLFAAFLSLSVLERIRLCLFPFWCDMSFGDGDECCGVNLARGRSCWAVVLFLPLKYRLIAKSFQGPGTEKYNITTIDIVWLSRFSQSQPHDVQSVGKTFAPATSSAPGFKQCRLP